MIVKCIVEDDQREEVVSHHEDEARIKMFKGYYQAAPHRKGDYSQPSHKGLSKGQEQNMPRWRHNITEEEKAKRLRDKKSNFIRKERATTKRTTKEKTDSGRRRI